MIPAIERKRIFIFIAIAFGLYLIVSLVIFLGGGLGTTRSSLLLCLAMFAPLIANLATRQITREGWSNSYLRPDFSGGRWRYYLAAWILPLVVILAGGAIYYLLFPGHFDPTMSRAQEMGMASAASAREPGKFFLIQLGKTILAPIPLFYPVLFLALGEEIGWRGYLLPKLLPLGTRKAILLVSLIWGAWHWPAILMGFNYGLDYWGAPVVGPLLWVVTLIFPSALFTWVTLRSGSVWPAAIAHSMDNAANELMWFFFRGTPNLLLGPGIQGIIGAAGYALLALVIFLSPRALARPETASAPGIQSSNLDPAAESAD